MLRTWRTPALSALLAVALASPARAEERLIPDSASQIDNLRLQMDALEKRLLGFGALDSEFGYWRKEVVEMRRQLTDIQATLRRLEAAQRDPNRSFNPDPMRSFNPDTVPVPGATTLTGVIRVQNLSGYDATVILNGTAYRAAAYQVTPLPSQPVGTLRYEVWAEPFGVLQPPVTRQLFARDPMTITINPR